MLQGAAVSGIATRCLRKIAYPTWEEADADASRINQQELRGIGELLIPYRCHYTPDHWHNGHVPWRNLRLASGAPAWHSGEVRAKVGCACTITTVHRGLAQR